MRGLFGRHKDGFVRVTHMRGLFGRHKDGFVRVTQSPGGVGKVSIRGLTRERVLRCCALAVCSVLAALRDVAAQSGLGECAEDFGLEDYLDLLDMEVRKILRDGSIEEG